MAVIEREVRNLNGFKQVREKVVAAVAPGVHDDSTKYFITGSEWFDRVTNQLWLCSDASKDAAVWAVASAGAAGAPGAAGTSQPTVMTEVARNAILVPALGQFIYNSTSNKLNFYNGATWEEVTSV